LHKKFGHYCPNFCFSRYLAELVFTFELLHTFIVGSAFGLAFRFAFGLVAGLLVGLVFVSALLGFVVGLVFLFLVRHDFYSFFIF